MKAIHLRTEYLKNPIGFEVHHPRLSWKCEGGKAQQDYEIRCAASTANLEHGPWLWQSGIVESWESLHIPYEGPETSGLRVYWQVRLCDETGLWGDWSEPALFEFGLLEDVEKNGAMWVDPEPQKNPNEELPVSIVRKDFVLDKPVHRARLYASALGIYEAILNGKRVGERLLTPGFTDMERRREYQTYDITNLLQNGTNVIAVSVADGWARSRLGFAGQRNQFSETIALWAQLRIEFEDGTAEIIGTDLSWLTTKDGPCRWSDMRDGEFYDARREGVLDNPDTNWESVLPASFDGRLEGTQGAPVHEIMRLQGTLLNVPNGDTVIDFGQNIAGYVEFTVHGKAGDTVKLVHGEVLDPDGIFTMSNFDFGAGSPEFPIVNMRQELTYQLSGNGTETYKPHFVTMGFRYVLVESWPGEVRAEDFSAVVVDSDVEETGTIETSDETLNQFIRNAKWSQRGNTVDIPTDCPHRERMGWTGDAQIFGHTASTNFQMGAFYTKWLRDVCSSQTPRGMILNTVPEGLLPGQDVEDNRRSSSGWGDVITILPWVLYLLYKDKRILEETYPAMKRWVDYQAASAASTHNHPENPLDEYIWDSGFHWGEWLEPGVPQSYYFTHNMEETATAYFASSAKRVCEIAAVLGREEEAKHYGEISNRAAEAYRLQFVEDGKPADEEQERQCRYVRPLAMGFLSDEEKRTAAATLNELLIQNQYKVGTGFLSTPLLLGVLTDHGYSETAYKALLNRECPGWLYSVTRGATTVWETWEGYKEDGQPLASHNHYSFGSVLEWLYRYSAGINPLYDDPGYHRFEIRPVITEQLAYVTASIDTMRGKIVSGWKRSGDVLTLHVEIPCNTKALITLPQEVTEVAEGSGLEFRETDGRMSVEALPGTCDIRCRIAEKQEKAA